MTRSALIVCTRNRPDDIGRLFASISNGNATSTVVVVDSSDGDATEGVVTCHRGLPVRYKRCEPGLTRQRMTGLADLPPEVEIVHFVDDDVVLEPGYLAAMERVFDTEPDVLGVGGHITNMPCHKPLLPARLFLLDSARGGVVLRSGVNVLAFSVPDHGRVQWLSGCCMSFRRCVFTRISFDTRMEGYSLGEDVDFTFRIGKLGPLCIAGRARLEHVGSMVNRESRHAIARKAAVHRYRWVCEMRGHGVSLAAYWWSIVGEILTGLTKGALRLRRDPIRRSWAILHAVRDIARVGPVRRNARIHGSRSGV